MHEAAAAAEEEEEEAGVCGARTAQSSSHDCVRSLRSVSRNAAASAPGGGGTASSHAGPGYGAMAASGESPAARRRSTAAADFAASRKIGLVARACRWNRSSGETASSSRGVSPSSSPSPPPPPPSPPPVLLPPPLLPPPPPPLNPTEARADSSWPWSRLCSASPPAVLSPPPPPRLRLDAFPRPPRGFGCLPLTASGADEQTVSGADEQTAAAPPSSAVPLFDAAPSASGGGSTRYMLTCPPPTVAKTDACVVSTWLKLHA
mmetsp:Transcript_49043/g.159337  ORF Transcript_49043/g.159337 Transcript_49043/m.159337 type:complete len:262 (-) Transcript_49043:221-1006(-)